MKKYVFTIIILLTIAIIAQGKKLGSFSQDYFKRPMLRVNDKYIYIVDQELKNGFIYNRSNFKKIAKFGGEGQGPGEFTGIENFTLNSEFIYNSNFPKLSIFSSKGELIKELIAPNAGGNFLPIGNNFIGTIYPFSDPNKNKIKIQISLFDSNLVKKKDLFITEINSFVYYPGGKKS